MTDKTDGVERLVRWLQSGTEERQLKAALALRNLATETSNKRVIREAGGIVRLLQPLHLGAHDVLTVVCAETLACLAADDPENRVNTIPVGSAKKDVDNCAICRAET